MRFDVNTKHQDNDDGSHRDDGDEHDDDEGDGGRGDDEKMLARRKDHQFAPEINRGDLYESDSTRIRIDCSLKMNDNGEKRGFTSL